MEYLGFDRPSFLSSFFGFFEVGPKLVADFTTGTYKASGVTKSFADVFTFNRAGKAWLVKDTGLVEYGIDVPRFDDGLLIEQSATNYAAWSFLQLEGTYNSRGLVLNSINKWVYDGIETSTVYLYSIPRVDNTNKSIIYSTVGVNGRFETIRTGTDFIESSHISNVDYAIKLNGDTNNITGLYYPKIANQYGLYFQAEALNTQKLPTTPIKTTTSPVTRPADFLAINNANLYGAIIAGDWDSTLSLSIVDGQLVHTGYGRIRSLEIN